MLLRIMFSGIREKQISPILHTVLSLAEIGVHVQMTWRFCLVCLFAGSRRSLAVFATRSLFEGLQTQVAESWALTEYLQHLACHFQETGA